MDRKQLEGRLERAFTGTPHEIGTGRVIEREEPYELAELVLPRREPTTHRDFAARHGDVLYELEQRGVEYRRLLELEWDGFGPVTFGGGLDLVGSGPQRYLCWWDEDESYRAVAAIFPWWEALAVSRTIERFLSSLGDDFGLRPFGRLPDLTTNFSPDLVIGDFVARAFFGAMQRLQGEHGDAWLSLAEHHFGRVVEPDHLQRCLDALLYAFDPERMNRGDVDEEARISESRAMPMQARRRLFAEWFQSAYLSVPETARL